MRFADLPITPLLPAVVAALRDAGRAVLQAPPGAGKTTAVPLALLDAVEGRIVMLEPRRVAARAAAERLAESLGEPVGGRVGYRIRGETRPGSRIEVVTEGVLTRMLQSAPDLPGVGCLIFDEFHERALNADLGLALALEARAALRPDLRLLVMSATLDAEPVAALMDGAPVLTAEGRAFPIETRWLDRPRRPEERLEAATAALVIEALATTEGGVLVFLPGQAEIGRTAAALALAAARGGRDPAAARRAAVRGAARGAGAARRRPQAGAGDGDRRDLADHPGRARRRRRRPGAARALRPGLGDDPAGHRARHPRRGRAAPRPRRPGGARLVLPALDPRRGGRHGRLPAARDRQRRPRPALALELAVWGAASPDGLAFLTPPPAPAFAEARALLTELGALDAAGRVTDHGRALARLPVHPRLGHMLLVAAGEGAGGLAADLAALVEARDPLRGRGADLGLRLDALSGGDPALGAVRDEARRLRRLAPSGPGGGLAPGAALSLAYPDRIAQRRPGLAPRYLLANGKGAALPTGDPLGAAPFLVAADLDGDPREATIRLGLGVTESDLRRLHGPHLRRETVSFWSRRDAAVLARERLTLGAIVLEDRPWRDVPPEAVAAALAGGIRELGLDALPWTPATRRLAARVEWLRAHGAADLPDFAEAALLAGLDDWLGPWLAGLSRATDLARVDLAAALDARLGRDGRQRLDRLAPAAIEAPTGTRLAIDYGAAAPTVSVRLQEMFGLTRHPTVGADAVPLVVELLSPAGRPVQTTADLPGFWRTSYADVRRDLRGRYPRHPWPEDPAAAAPTRRAKPRGS